MSRPSPRSTRKGRPRPGHVRVLPSAEVKAIMQGDYPPRLKARVWLAAKGALHGKRQCLACGGPGWETRVHIAPAALSVDRLFVPDDVMVYWLCRACSQLPSDDERIVQALASARSAKA